jgi:hypothetical protein
MRTFLGALGALVLAAAAGCGGGTSGETANGTAMIDFIGDQSTISVGAALAEADSPGKMLVVFGTNHIDCGFDPQSDSLPESGTYVSFSASATTPGTDAQAQVSVEKITSSSIDGYSSNGSVTIDAIADRVTGSIQFTDMSQDENGNPETVSVSGTFDVKKCF